MDLVQISLSHAVLAKTHAIEEWQWYKQCLNHKTFPMEVKHVYTINWEILAQKYFHV